jgi:hypothetical protein
VLVRGGACQGCKTSLKNTSSSINFSGDLIILLGALYNRYGNALKRKTNGSRPFIKKKK